MGQIKYLKDADITNKRVLLRVDYNVSMDEHHKISNDTRITQSLPTINHMIKNNKIIIISHLNRPKKRDSEHSLAPVVEWIKTYLPDTKITLVNDFLTEDKSVFENQKNGEIIMLENIRFYPEEQACDPEFAKKLAELGDVYVNDAFGVDHHPAASLTVIDQYLPSYAGLLLEKEVKLIGGAIENPQKPFVALLGGAKVSDEIKLISRLIEIADQVLLGGGIANPFLAAAGFPIGKSICEQDMIETARSLIEHAANTNTDLVFPIDVTVGDLNSDEGGEVVKITDVPPDKAILDIGSETEANFGAIIAHAKTIVWNGPVGVFENPEYRQGTDFIYYSIVRNPNAISIIGGGDTLAAIARKVYIEKITHISTGGGAMLELIEKGTLPGIEALKQ